MNTAKKINYQINYHTKAAYELASSQPCPRSANDVYSLGVGLQYCIRAKCIEIGNYSRTLDKQLLDELAAKQLTIKSEIEKMAKYNLNELLVKFYNSGGPIMADPVSKQMAKDNQRFFSLILSNFLQSLDDAALETLRGKLSVEEMERDVENKIAELYASLARMFPVKEIEIAFADLVKIRQS